MDIADNEIILCYAGNSDYSRQRPISRKQQQHQQQHDGDDDAVTSIVESDTASLSANHRPALTISQLHQCAGPKQPSLPFMFLPAAFHR